MSRSASENQNDLGVSDVERLEKVIGDTAHLLPTQGPIGVFIHHNTLHAFQQPCSTQQHGDVGIVATGMHATAVAGGEVKAGGFVDWQRIHICPEGNHWGPAANSGHHTRLGYREPTAQ